MLHPPQARHPRRAYLYLDNASVHRKAALIAIINIVNASLGTLYILVFPPPYSPELNPVRAVHVVRGLSALGLSGEPTHAAGRAS